MSSRKTYTGEKACRINDKIVSHSLNIQQKVEINHYKLQIIKLLAQDVVQIP